MNSVVTTAAGWASIDALLRHLDRERSGDVFAPAVVLVDNAVLATALRRAAVRRCAALQRPGLAGVDFITINRLAEQLAEPVLLAEQGHCASRIELLVALRNTLRAEPGRFGSVADHRTTEERLVAFHHEITGLPDDLKDQLEATASGLSADALRVVRQASTSMSRAFDENRLVDLAIAELGTAPDGARGPLVLFNPEPTRPYEGRLIQALARRADASVVVTLTGHRRIDEAYLRRLAAWSIQVDTGTAGADDAVDPEPLKARPAPLVEVAAPDEEVRAAVRELSAHAASGVPLTEMAVLYSFADPYASLLSEQLSAAGIPTHGPGYRPLNTSLAGRTLRRLLDLAADGLDRQAVMALLNSAPIRGADGGAIPALLWDRVSRQAGVIDGEHWQARLDELAASLTGPDPGEQSSRAAVVALADFVAELRENLRPPRGNGWTAWTDWAKRLLDRYLGASAGSRWPDEEIQALGTVRSLLDDIGSLDGFGTPPDLDVFGATVGSELSNRIMGGHSGSGNGPEIGRGVYVAPLSTAAGLPFRRIMMVGAVEGQFPRVPREDSLLPDQLRARARGLMIEKSQVTDIDVRSAAVAAASSVVATTFYTSRGDLRSNRSRAWPEQLRSIVVSTPQVIASHYQGLVDHGRAASIDDFALRALIDHVDGGDPVHTHTLAARDPVLAAGFRRHLDRIRNELTNHTGRVRRNMIDPTEHLFSPTALETYALCPRKYLFQRVLRLVEDERPERIAEITPRDRGQLVHRVLERFLSEALEDDDVPSPGESWPADRQARLFDILDEEIKVDQSRGITGGEVRTRLLRQWLIAEMHLFLESDDELRAAYGSTPWAAEFSFGFEDSPALEGLYAGRHLRLRGSVDRVDLTDDGGLVVIDYKGGSGRQFDKLETNPLDDGRRLQLPLYARAVAERLDRTGPQIGLYWLTQRGDHRPLELDDNLNTELEAAVGAALTGSAKGCSRAYRVVPSVGPTSRLRTAGTATSNGYAPPTGRANGNGSRTIPT